MKKHVSYSIHEAAPELQLEMIAKLSGILAKYDKKNMSSEQLTFYQNMLRVMRFGYAHMENTRYIHERNIMLENNVRWLSELNNNLQKQLDEFNTVLRLKCQGRLDEVIEQAEQYTDYVMSLKKMNHKTEN